MIDVLIPHSTKSTPSQPSSPGLGPLRDFRALPKTQGGALTKREGGGGLGVLRPLSESTDGLRVKLRLRMYQNQMCTKTK